MRKAKQYTKQCTIVAFEKGHKKVGGKQKGFTDDGTKGARELFKLVIEGEFHHIQESMAKARAKDPIKYLEVLSKFASFIIPRKIDQETTLKVESPIIIDWKDKPNE